MRDYQPDGWVDASGDGHAHFLGELHGTTHDTTCAIARQALFLRAPISLVPSMGYNKTGHPRPHRIREASDKHH
jgi:hypothetical protein